MHMPAREGTSRFVGNLRRQIRVKLQVHLAGPKLRGPSVSP